VSRLEISPPASVRFVLGRTVREPARLARALNARWLVDGQLLSSGGSVRVSVQLIEAAGLRVRWTGAFQRPTEDLFAVISGVADSVATAIVGTLAPAERASLVRRPTASNDALVAYTRGLAALRHYDETNVRLAVSSFESSVGADSGFARAWAGLAEALMWEDAYTPARQLYPRAGAAAERALALDPASAPAFASLSAKAMGYDWDPPRAESLARRALHLDTTNARAWVYLADALVGQDRADEAMPAYRLAVAADTLDEQVATEAASGYQFARHPDESLALIARWRRMLPRSEFWDRQEGVALAGARRCGAAPQRRPISAVALACAGQRAAARAVLDTMVGGVERGALFIAPHWIAQAYVALGDNEAALRWVARSIEARTYTMGFARQDPIWDQLRGDPRFAALLLRIRPEPQ
jgi:tetratricopeptide (TPR) repeat protein